MSKILESMALVPAIIPVDLMTAANDGDWVNLKHYNRCLVVLYKAAGTAGNDPIFKLQQATAAAGTGAKDILFTRVYSKLHATDVGTVEDFTQASQTAATSYTDATSAEKQGMIAVEISADMMDVAGGFTFLRLDIADVGAAANLGCAFYILFEPRYQGADMPSAIA